MIICFSILAGGQGLDAEVFLALERQNPWCVRSFLFPIAYFHLKIADVNISSVIANNIFSDRQKKLLWNVVISLTWRLSNQSTLKNSLLTTSKPDQKTLNYILESNTFRGHGFYNTNVGSLRYFFIPFPTTSFLWCTL